MDERRVGLGEVVRTLNRIDSRTARIEAALFEEVGLITRVVVLERQAEEDAEERRLNRIMAAVATLIGSTVGALVGLFAHPK